MLGVSVMIPGNLSRVRLAKATSDSITGTSTSTPTTVASAAPEFRPKEADGHRHRQFEEVRRADQRAGRATLWGSFHAKAQA
jgi:hypothetical protein